MIQQLYPYVAETPLRGAYLGLNLHQRCQAGEVFIYANYISSVDGRISVYDEKISDFSVPKFIANARDWRLYQELAAQSDVMLTSARYFRQLAVSNAQDLLPVGQGKAFADIRDWRAQQGLKAQPDVVILSDTLNIPQAAIESLKDRNIYVFTSKQTSRAPIERLRNLGVIVLESEDKVSGAFIRAQLQALGFVSAYMIAGPQVHHTLVAERCVDELFLTSHFSLLGGESFHSVIDQPMPAVGLKLKSLFLDEDGSQMFMRFAYQKEQSNHA